MKIIYNFEINIDDIRQALFDKYFNIVVILIK